MAKDAFSTVQASQAKTLHEGSTAPQEVVKPDPIAPQAAGTPGIVSLPPENLWKEEQDNVARETMRVVGEMTPQMSPQQAALAGQLKEQHKNYEKAGALTRLKEGKAYSHVLASTAALYDEDFEAAQEFNRQHFERYDRHKQQFEADVDAVRELRFDDQRFYKALGPSGRMTSALSVGLAQLAAGAGNPNSVSQRIDAAINRDIQSQQLEMQHAVQQMQASGSLTEMDRQAIEDFYTFEDKKRALFNFAAAAEMGRAKQTARNEMEYQVFQMIENQRLAAALASDAQMRAAMTTLHFDGKAKSLAELRRRIRQQKAAYALYDQEMANNASAPSLPDTGIQMSPDGPVIGGGESLEAQTALGVPEAPEVPRAALRAQSRKPRGTPQGGTEEAVKAPQAPATAKGEVTVEANPLSPSFTSALETEGTPYRDDVPGGSVTFTAEETEEDTRPRTSQGDPLPATYDEFRDLAAAYGMPPEVFDKGGYTYAMALKDKRTIEGGSPRFQDALRAFLDPSNEDVRVFADEHDARIGLKFDTRPDSPRVRYEREHPEALVVPRKRVWNPDTARYESNYIEVTGLGKLFLGENHPARAINSDPKFSASAGKSGDPRELLKSELNKHYKYMNKLGRATELSREGAFSGLSDLFVMKEDGTWSTTAFGKGTAELLREGKALGKELAFGIITANDEGRKTDFDMQIGAEMVMGTLDGQPIQEIIEELKGTIGGIFTDEQWENQIIRSQRVFMQGLAYKAAEDMAEKLADAGIVLPYEQYKMIEARRLQAQRNIRLIQDSTPQLPVKGN